MNITAIAASLAALTIFASAPVLAADIVDAPAPITLHSGHVLPSPAGPETGGGLVAIDFENTADQAATDVLFEVVSDTGGLVSRIHDRGSFAPHVPIRHTFPAFEVAQNDRVEIGAVRLADGTVYTNTSAARSLRQQSDALFETTALRDVAVTADGTEPVAITGIEHEAERNVGNLEQVDPGALDVAFRNTSDTAATEVIFNVAVDGVHVGSLQDASVIAPGETVRRRFPDTFAPNATIAVALVSFADGSVWINERLVKPQTLRRSVALAR